MIMRWRHLLITIFIIPYLIIYAIIAIFFIDLISGINWILDLLVFAIFGFLWIIPTIPFVNWLAKNES